MPPHLASRAKQLHKHVRIGTRARVGARDNCEAPVGAADEGRLQVTLNLAVVLLLGEPPGERI